MQFHTAAEFLLRGLEKAGFTPCQIQENNEKKNLQRFRAHYGSNPIVLEKQWQDLQQTQNAEAKVNLKYHNWNDLLMTHYYLRLYPTETVMSARWDYSEKTIREKVWRLAYKIAALKAEKVQYHAVWERHSCALHLSQCLLLLRLRSTGFGMTTTFPWVYLLSRLMAHILPSKSQASQMTQRTMTTRMKLLVSLTSWLWHCGKAVLSTGKGLTQGQRMMVVCTYWVRNR